MGKFQLLCISLFLFLHFFFFVVMTCLFVVSVNLFVAVLHYFFQSVSLCGEFVSNFACFASSYSHFHVFVFIMCPFVVILHYLQSFILNFISLLCCLFVVKPLKGVSSVCVCVCVCVCVGVHVCVSWAKIAMVSTTEIHVLILTSQKSFNSSCNNYLRIFPVRG